MPSQYPINPAHRTARRVLRVVGPLLLMVGLIFVVVGVVDFFAAFGGGGPPTKFWCPFVGVPLMFIGFVLTMTGFMGAVARFTAQEQAPVATDTFNYVADNTRDGVRQIAGAIGAGLRQAGGAAEGARVRCHACQTDNDPDAKFCDACGTALRRSAACPACGEVNDADARYCDNCGRALADG